MAGIIKISVLADAANAVRGFKQTASEAEKMSGKISGSVGRLAGLAFGAIGVGTLVSAFKTGVDEVQHFEDAANQVNAALATNAKLSGLSAASVQEQSAALETLTGAKIDENDATLAQATLIRAGVSTQKDLRGALKASADVALATGKDIGTVSTALGKALADPAKASGVLARSGVVLSDAQQKTINAMVETGDTAGAQALVIADLEAKYKGASEAAGKGLSADLGRAQDALADAERDITKSVIPTLSKLATAFAKDLPKAIEKATPVVKEIWAVVSDPVFLKVAGSVLAVVVALKTYSVIAGVVTAATTVWRDAQLLLDAAMAANPIGLIVIAVVALIAGIVYLATKTQFFQTVWAAVWSAVSTAAQAIANFFVGIYRSVTGFVDGVINAIRGVIARVRKIGTDIVTGLRDGIAGAWHFVTDKVHALVGLIPKAVRDFLGIKSPSTVMASLGAQVTSGLADGILGQRHQVTAAMQALNTAVATGVTATPVVGVTTVPAAATIDTASGGGTASGTTYAINVTVQPGADPAEVGRQTVNAIEAYERRSGRVRLVSA